MDEQVPPNVSAPVNQNRQAEHMALLAKRVWPWIQRVSFRFVFCYFVLYILPFPFNHIPGYYQLTVKFGNPWQQFVLYIADAVFRVPGPIAVGPNGSGDTTYDYLSAAVIFCIAAIVGLIWNLGSPCKAYPRLMHWFHVLIRYYLATTMLGYGFAKIIPAQFPVPGLGRLMQPYGESSPMGLLWTFMGNSPPYVIFAGAMEALGGFLLFFRQTTILGGIVLIGVLANVVMLNFCYDVPVKLFSSHLLVLSIILVLPHWRRLLNVCLINRTADPCSFVVPVASPITKWTLFGLKVVILLWILYQQGMGVYYQATNYVKFTTEKPPLYGLYEVVESRADGVSQPLLITNPALYKRAAFAEYGSFALVHMNDERGRYTVEVRENSGTIIATSRVNPNEVSTLSFRKEPGDILILTGKLGQESIDLTLHKLSEDKFLLRSRGFHWINEFPFNR